MENEFENTDSSNGENENADSQNGEEVDVETLQKQLAEKEEQNKKLFERAKQAEALAKQLKIKPEEKPEPPKTPAMDLKDIRALQDVHDDDVDELIEYAKFKGVSVAEIKKSPVIQAHLKVKAEERATAQATTIGKSGGRTSKVTGQSLLEKVYSTNELPTDEEGVRAFVQARIAEKLDKKS